jgi:hypothetical protein
MARKKKPSEPPPQDPNQLELALQGPPEPLGEAIPVPQALGTRWRHLDPTGRCYKCGKPAASDVVDLCQEQIRIWP